MGFVRFFRSLVGPPEHPSARSNGGGRSCADAPEGASDDDNDLVGPPLHLGRRLTGPHSHSSPDLSTSLSFSEPRADGEDAPTRSSRRSAYTFRRFGAPSAVRVRGGLDLRRSSSFREVVPREEGTKEPTTKDKDADVIGNYVNFVHIHRGSRATLLKAQSLATSRYVVLKVFSKAFVTPMQQNSLTREVAALKALSRHSGVVSFSHAMEDADNVYLVMMPLRHSLLEQFMASTCNGSKEQRLRSVATSILTTLHLIHTQSIIHRDLKPEHVMQDSEGRWRLIDFGHCADVREDWPHEQQGTLPYMAPEVMDKPSAEDAFRMVLEKGLDERDLPPYDSKCDIWSFGVMLFELLIGRQPFAGDTISEVQQMVATLLQERDENGRSQLLAQHQFPATLEDFLDRALSLDPAKRASAAELLDHAWLAGGVL